MEENKTRSESTEYVYDPNNGEWSSPAVSMAVSAVITAGSIAGEYVGNAVEVIDSATGKDPSSEVDSKGKADKEYIEIEFNTLVGDLTVFPSKKNICIKVNDTIEILGVGSYLSGKYFVSSVKRTLNRDSGYSQNLTVIKNGFGDSLKGVGNSSESDRVDRVEKSTSGFKEGDSVKIVGDAVYSNASEGVKVPAWVKEQTLTVRQVSSDGTRVLLMPILSWTYTKYVQKI